MKLGRFLLEEWLERHETSARYNLAASTGPSWTLEALLDLASAEERERFFQTGLTYCPGAGHESLRHEIASMYGASAEEVQIVTGASEALLSLFFLAAEPGANVVVPHPSFPPFLDIPESLGLETRRYALRYENGYAIDADELEGLVDASTKMILVNSPQNPTGAVVSEESVRALEALAAKHGAQLVVDEVYHPIYEGKAPRSAGEYTGATILGDFSKAFSLAGLRVGWVLERDPARRKDLWNARGHFTISNNMPGEILAEIATRNREVIFERAREVSRENLARLDRLFDEQGDRVEWVRPRGGMTGFPRFRHVEDARPFCEAAVARGVLLSPGDCFGYPAHFRIGFGACAEGYRDAVAILSGVLAETDVAVSRDR